MTTSTRRQKYPNGTVLKPSAKALRRHPNHFAPEDRFYVTGPRSALWFKVADWTDPFSGKTHKAATIIMAGDEDTGEIDRAQDSYVEPDPELAGFSFPG